MVLTGTLRKWNPRPACGTAFSSVHNISSVCVCVCAGAQVCAVEVATLLGGPQIGVIFKLFLVVTLCLANFSPLVYVVLCLNR